MFWAPAAAPSVVSLMATLPAVGLGSLAREDLDTWRQVRADGLDWYRLDGHSLAIAVGDHGEPLGFLLPVDDAWSVRLLAAERASLLLLGRSAPRYLTRQQGERIRGALRAIDGQDHGESYRAIATVFFGQKRIDAEHWKTSSLKARVARLVAHGRMLIARGYRQLLRGRLSKK